MNTKIYFLVLVFFSLYSCEDNKNVNNINSYHTNLVEKGFSGVILINIGDNIIHKQAYGFKNLHNKMLNETNTVFDIGSISKQFTGAGIMKLVMNDYLSLDDNLKIYFDNVSSDKEDITIQQLLTHSSGLVDGVGDDYETITTEEFLTRVFNTNLISPPGKEYHYSNVGYSLLAIIIEKVSALNYEEFLNKEIFVPSKMNHTGYVLPNWEINDIANGIHNDKEMKRPNEENWNKHGPYLNLKGNGGILSTANDLLLWSKSLKNNIVLDEKAKHKYLFPSIKEEEDGNSYYGYGWVIVNHGKENMLVWHNGGNDIFFADMWIYPQKDITIIVLCNKYEEYVDRIAEELSNILLN